MLLPEGPQDVHGGGVPWGGNHQPTHTSEALNALHDDAAAVQCASARQKVVWEALLGCTEFMQGTLVGGLVRGPPNHKTLFIPSTHGISLKYSVLALDGWRQYISQFPLLACTTTTNSAPQNRKSQLQEWLVNCACAVVTFSVPAFSSHASHVFENPKPLMKLLFERCAVLD